VFIQFVPRGRKEWKSGENCYNEEHHYLYSLQTIIRVIH
jgi:hypothetical protein